MKEDKRIKDMYRCSYIQSATKLNPLQKWYNKVIDKRVSELELSDVLRMIRQNEFIDLAATQAVIILKANPFAGEMYEGELLEKLSEIENSIMKQYIGELREILRSAFEENRTHEWIDEEERKEFDKVIGNFIEKISIN